MTLFNHPILFALVHALTTSSVAADAAPAYPDPPEISTHGSVGGSTTTSTIGEASVIKAKVSTECNFSGEDPNYEYVAMSDKTCFGWTHTANCTKPWSLCDTSQGMHGMYEQLRAQGSNSVTIGRWKGSFHGKTTGFVEQDAFSFEEAIVLANGHNERMTFSTESFNAFQWEDAAGATAYFWGTEEGVASIRRVGGNAEEMCTPVDDAECRASSGEL
ncbi:hypothetical protein FH972_024947 [Carpinus fangiana]|uniref:Uncharacterized protein n=1 Tax=Carpinus fangiana TaxID=176857 RepID=A0A5N6KZU9_9ROSI|nr:hypothetical protein FH972_024947 [Carpinus fangiana]